ncbi:MAG: serine hydrolase [Gammaproteobacteria bacterium]|nr:serine hydrolase [Gammaproteobacteria bacterium]
MKIPEEMFLLFHDSPGTGPSTGVPTGKRHPLPRSRAVQAKTAGHGLFLLFSLLILFPSLGHSEEPVRLDDKAFFTLDNDVDLRESLGAKASKLLALAKGQGMEFGAAQAKRYCTLKNDHERVQWVLNDLETGEVISRSANADKRFFGASVSKLFVAAALLDKQQGTLDTSQLDHLVRMIVVSDNLSWKELQRQAGELGTNDSGREAVDEFVQRMGYSDTKGFQGWLRKKDGTRIHGNELNALELSQFLYDTYHGNYPGAEVLWKVMHATRTGRSRIDKYTPSYVNIGGKTGTYDGPNASPQTIQHETIRARNHVAVMKIDDKYYGLSILSNTGRNEDVAVLGGGLIREYLGVEDETGVISNSGTSRAPSVACPASGAESVTR